ncbi:MAG: queuosine precursor transporter [Deltaproteobacteria bacterium]|nr:queuosine precursor transporter [Deltaproteobacteria bacterium]MBW2121410.1 queuosine precursor transporter [Deltaproteobacteria bacterium]
MDRERGNHYHLLGTVTALFVTVLLTSNIASAAKIVDLRVSIGTFPLAFDGGTFLFPLSYIFGDVLTEVYGYRISRRVIWTGFGCAALMSLTFFVLGRLPGEPSWERAAGQAAYDKILGSVGNGGIIAASLCAYWAGEFSNSYVLAKMKIVTRGRWLWARTIGSTIVGEGVDTVLFVGIATLLGVFPVSAMASLVVANYLFKVGVEVVMTPVTYRLCGLLKRIERVDVYDYDTSFNPFRLEFSLPGVARK